MTSQPAASKRLEVLLVEDDHADVINFKETLTNSRDHDSKIVIAVCHSLRDAETALQQQRFDLILLDINLPDAKELEGFKRLLMLFPEVPIVIHSEIYSGKLASEAIALGAQDYIVKGTMSKEDLVRTLVHAKMRHEVHRRLRHCLDEV